MRHVLFHQREKPDQPIRATELVSLVKDSLPKATSAGVIAQAQALLMRELGLELKKIELATGRGATSTSTACSDLLSPAVLCAQTFGDEGWWLRARA